MNIFTELDDKWRATLPNELVRHAPTVLRRIEAEQADALRDAFSAETLAELVNHPLLDWLWRTYERFRAGIQGQLPDDAPQHVQADWQGRGTGDLFGAPLSALSALTPLQVSRLEAALGWVTVRDVAVSTSLEAARAIHRAATGKPAAPYDPTDRPLPDYFSGGVRQYKDRLREAAGISQRSQAAAQDEAQPSGAAQSGRTQSGETHTGETARRSGPWPAPPPPPPPPPSPALSVAGAEVSVNAPSTQQKSLPQAEPPPVQPFRVQPPPDPQQPVPVHPGQGVRPAALAASFPRPQPRILKGYTPDGKYMPIGGGSRGWHKNAGVARNERAGGYGYSHAIDEAGFAHSGLEQRIRTNLRGAERKTVRMQVRYARGEDESTTPGLCLDISLTGAKIRIGQKLRQGTAVNLSFVERNEVTGDEVAFLALSGTAVWSTSVDKHFRVQRYDCGLQFDSLDLATKERLLLVLNDRVQDLIGDSESPAPFLGE